MEQIFDWFAVKQQSAKFIAIYFLVLIAILVSHTVNKINRYFGLLLIFSCIDIITFLVDIWSTLHLQTMPYFTAAASVFLLIMELRSVYKKSDAKYQSNVQETAKAIGRIIKNRDDAEKVIEALMEYMNEKKGGADETKA